MTNNEKKRNKTIQISLRTALVGVILCGVILYIIWALEQHRWSKIGESSFSNEENCRIKIFWKLPTKKPPGLIAFKVEIFDPTEGKGKVHYLKTKWRFGKPKILRLEEKIIIRNVTDLSQIELELRNGNLVENTSYFLSK